VDTLALDLQLWDLDVDSRGNWRTVGDATPLPVTTGPGMRLAQDVATRCMAWRGEVYYDATQGIRFENILGQGPNTALAQDAFQTEALKVPDCNTALPNFTFTPRTRQLGGTMTVSNLAGYGGTVVLPT
jgi:hypothetical protein